MIQISIPQKYVEIIKNLYNDTNCAIIADGQLIEWFPLHMGVIQGCFNVIEPIQYIPRTCNEGPNLLR